MRKDRENDVHDAWREINDKTIDFFINAIRIGSEDAVRENTDEILVFCQ
jgi:hypothetical protein